MAEPAKDPHPAARIIWVDLIADALFFYNRHLGFICLVVLPFSLPTCLLQLAGKGGLATIVNTTTAPVYCGALIVYFAGILRDERWTPGQCLMAGFAFWPRMLVASLLVEAAVILGLMALVLPGLVLAARFGFFDYLIVLEGCGPLQSLRTSFEMSKAYTLQITATFTTVVAPIAGLDIALNRLLTADSPAFAGYTVAADLLQIVVLVLFFRIYCRLKNEQAQGSGSPPVPS
jgi:hypothetical protein